MAFIVKNVEFDTHFRVTYVVGYSVCTTFFWKMTQSLFHYWRPELHYISLPTALGFVFTIFYTNWNLLVLSLYMRGHCVVISQEPVYKLTGFCLYSTTLGQSVVV